MEIERIEDEDNIRFVIRVTKRIIHGETDEMTGPEE